MGTEERRLEGPWGLEGRLRIPPWPRGRDHSPSVIPFESVAACSAFKDMGTDKSPPLYSGLTGIGFVPFPTPSRAGLVPFNLKQSGVYFLPVLQFAAWPSASLGTGLLQFPSETIAKKNNRSYSDNIKETHSSLCLSLPEA